MLTVTAVVFAPQDFRRILTGLKSLNLSVIDRPLPAVPIHTGNAVDTIQCNCSSICGLCPCDARLGIVCRAGSKQGYLSTNTFYNTTIHLATHVVTESTVVIAHGSTQRLILGGNGIFRLDVTILVLKQFQCFFQVSINLANAILKGSTGLIQF